MIIRNRKGSVKLAKFALSQIRSFRRPSKGLERNEDLGKMEHIHSSVAVRTWKMIAPGQDELNFLWDVRLNGLSLDNRRRWASVLLEDSMAVFFKWPVMTH